MSGTGNVNKKHISPSFEQRFTYLHHPVPKRFSIPPFTLFDHRTEVKRPAWASREDPEEITLRMIGMPTLLTVLNQHDVDRINFHNISMPYGDITEQIW
jgi:hypothetical protein